MRACIGRLALTPFHTWPHKAHFLRDARAACLMLRHCASRCFFYFGHSNLIHASPLPFIIFLPFPCRARNTATPQLLFPIELRVLSDLLDDLAPTLSTLAVHVAETAGLGDWDFPVCPHLEELEVSTVRLWQSPSARIPSSSSAVASPSDSFFSSPSSQIRGTTHTFLSMLLGMCPVLRSLRLPQPLTADELRSLATTTLAEGPPRCVRASSLF